MHLKYRAEAAAGRVAGVNWVDTSRVRLAPYVVQPGDSLSSIAQRVYGDLEQWRAIAQANSLPDPNLILPGQILSLP
ncbi:MAG: LysM peptidoglycan-binding domain-containing protein [Anaerolineae bacterium]|nr:LysM peptidoglycan-binding domain-containing protein [Anaerolineae bacterium]